jgi:predicted unusual protein kinase regulating ubiquinone biosynthesis (AarF/ABC1/UbiB family)
VNEIGNQVPLELDFVREGELTRRVAENLRDYPGVAVPPVVDGMVSRKVLVTEYLEGTRLLGEPGQPSPVADGPAAARAITEAYGHQILVDGLFQADPHPGNLLALPDGRVGLVDFGLTKELPDQVRIGFARLVVAAADRDPMQVMAAFKELGLRTRNADPDGLLGLTRLFFDARGQDARGPVSPRRRETLNRSPIDSIPGDLVLLGRVVGLLRGVCASLGSPLTPMQMLKPHAERVLGSG